jgi:tRNA(Arg) A34 adenosine deaminase TadA
MRRAIELAVENVRTNRGGPFGCVIARDGKIIAEGTNLVVSTNDPTAHAEIVAIRRACEKLGTFQLTGHDVITSCEPCPMCLGAMLWARPDRIVYACTHADAADIGFDDAFVYDEIAKPRDLRTIPMTQILRTEALEPFRAWATSATRTDY